jgi:NAD(P)-dependent dehydrogenase (short-subunit alcohol dehydrogenase family)
MLSDNDSLNVKGSTVCITGAASGIGKALTKCFLDAGAYVAALDQNIKGLHALREALDNPRLSVFEVQLIEKDALIKISNEVAYTMGGVHTLINNAGILDDFLPVHEISDLLWDKVMKINFHAPFLLCREFIPQMLQRGYGNIINIASVGGTNGCRAGAAYTSSKHAMIGLTKNIAYTYAKKGIRCNAIAPGAIETAIAEGMKPDSLGYERSSSGFGLIPRSGKPEEIASIALFLASKDSSMINGAVITADAGWTAY